MPATLSKSHAAYKGASSEHVRCVLVSCHLLSLLLPGPVCRPRQTEGSKYETLYESDRGDPESRTRCKRLVRASTAGASVAAASSFGETGAAPLRFDSSEMLAASSRKASTTVAPSPCVGAQPLP